jgi:hypothetical protein
MLLLIERWFSQVTPSQDYRRTDYLVLGLIIALGIIVRFWGLDNVGLHGDERHMATPAMAILETGHPYLPSGMYYSRALLQIYLMSGSVWLFGESEWAFRLPSAIVGSLAGLAAFFMGRRFLGPQFNLAFVATLTFLPSMIVVSQTARMYVFFVTFMILFAACIFRWERDQRISSLVLALVVWLLALHMQTLAIFGALLFLFPGLSRQSWKLLFQGGLAFVLGYAVFDGYRKWISSGFPNWEDRPPPVEEIPLPVSLDVLLTGYNWLVVGSVAVILLLGIVSVAKAINQADWRNVLPPVLMLLGLLAMSVLHYHIGGILVIAATVFWLRARELPRNWLLAALLFAVGMTVVHLVVLYDTGLFPGRRLIGALVGTPSVWPILRFFVYSPFAATLYGIVVIFALVRFASGERLPKHFLFFAISVWVPLLMIGFFVSYMPPRYGQGQLGFFLLCVFAGFAYLARELKWTADRDRVSRPVLAVLVLISVAMINPAALARVVNPSYGVYPDHKGAAEFIQSLDLSEDAILIAEDVVHQTYYLGRVDYSLRPVDDAVVFSVMREGRMVDQYTGAPVIGTGAELEELLDRERERDIYIIGSGENFINGDRILRRQGIAEVLASARLEVVYEGRDSRTRVWRARSQ